MARKLHKLGCVIPALTLLLARPITVSATTYTFTRIVDGWDVYSGIGPPAIADDGTVAFRALENGVDGIRTGNGGLLTTISDANGPANTYNVAVIAQNGGGAVFLAFLDAGGPQGIYRGFGGPVTTVVDNTGTLNNISTPFDSNATGVIAFRSTLDSFQSGIYRSDGNTITTIIDSVGSPSTTTSFTAGINDNSVVVFYATQSGVASIRTGTGGSLTTLLDNTGPLNLFLGQPQINNNGEVIFVGTLDTGATGMFTTNGSGFTTIATTDGPVSSFNDVNLIVPSINDAGQIAYWAKLDDNSTGMFTGPDLVTGKVILTGDALDGSTVVSVRHGRGITPTGQLCFQATLSNGHIGIYRADPVPTAIPGDMNCDSTLDYLDVEPFTLVLLDPDAYMASFPTCDETNADINNDGFIDGLDVGPFIDLLLP